MKYCPHCRKSVDDKHNCLKKFYGSKQWTKDARQYKIDNPICQHCQKNLSQQVHHKRKVIDAPHLALDPSNWLALCRDCHKKLEKWS